MTLPLAFLNDEEMHWQSDLGLPNQRRWLNHRTLGDEHRRTFPSACTDSSISGDKKDKQGVATKAQKAQKENPVFCFIFCDFVPFVAKAFCG
jgi:hypothetical protein